jgi:Peptidase family M28
MNKFAWLFGLIVCAGAALYWYTLVMPGRPHTGPLPPLSQDERAMANTMRGYVEGIASRPHNTAFPNELEASARRIEATLRSFGYAPTAQHFKAAGVDVRNIEVLIEPPTGSAKDLMTLVVGAHYDSADHAPGANDNGSGVAALLILARELRRQPRQKTRLRLVFFVNEEPPHFQTATMGSLIYARALAATGERVSAMISLETLGSYSDQKGSQTYPPPLGYPLPDTGNFVAIVGDMSARALAADVTRRFRDSTAFPSLGGVAPGSLPGITWSDHWSFSRFKIAAVMITDTAVFRYPHYHLPTDTPDKLDYERLARVTTGLVRVVSGLAP